MAQKIRLWEVADENVVSEIPSDSIPLEGRLEDWLAINLAVLDPDRMAEHLGMDRALLESVLPEDAKEHHGVRNWSRAAEERQIAIGLEGVFRTTEEVAKFAQAVQAAARNRP